MGDNLEDILNVTMKRLEIIMQDAETALENRAENLLKAADHVISTCVEYGMIKKEKEEQCVRQLYGYAKELYIQTLTHIPRKNEKDQYLQSFEIMKQILACKRRLMEM